MMTEQALGKRAIETFDNGLVSVNLNAAAANVCLVAFHFFCHTSHKLAARVDCACKSTGRPSQPQQNLSRSEALLLGNGWQFREQSVYICKSSFHEEACHGAEKEGPLSGPSWASPRQILDKVRIAVLEDKSARESA